VTDTPRILAFAGSLRQGSYNKRLLRIAAEGAHEAGAEVTVIDLADYPMPLYDGDLERNEGMPEKARAFKKLLTGHHGLLIASPEYNSGMTAALKNAIDWASRRSDAEERPLAVFTGKVAAILGTSTGSYGAMRSLGHTRMVLTAVGVLVIPQQRAVPKAPEAFDGDRLKDPELDKGIRAIGARLIEVARRLG
jgi:chromate reductase, NAD(P)H dehydrogenase (quinone)